MDIYSRLLKDRIIFVGTEINDQVANAVVAQLVFLRAEDPKKDVSIYINSPGGIVSAGLAIYDTMRFLGVDINTYCVGQAVGLAAILLCAGTKGKRFSLPHSRVMLHQPKGMLTGSSSEIYIQAQEIVYMKKEINVIAAKHTGQPLEKIIEESERDFYMSPEEAVSYGLIDQVVVLKEG